MFFSFQPINSGTFWTRFSALPVFTIAWQKNFLRLEKPSYLNTKKYVAWS
jgi:hypothetical protein